MMMGKNEKRKSPENLKIAIVYEWFFRMAGGERCIDGLCEIFPEAEIFVLFGSKKNLLPNIKEHKIHYSFLQKIPGIRKIYRYTYFLWPSAIETFKFDDYDIVLSVNHCVAKGIVVPENIPHISYIFTPMRYAWDMSYEYFNKNHFSGFKQFAINLFLPYLRFWDYYSSKRPQKIAVISEFAGGRIKKYYKRDYEKIIRPPVDIQKAVYDDMPSDYYVAIAPFEPNKYGDVIVDAAKHSGFKLKLIGEGSMKKKLEKGSRGFRNIEFLGRISEKEKFKILSRAKGFITMGTEDFGIAPVEAQACGIPVIGYNAGGVRETVIDDKTGILLNNRTKESLSKATEDLEIKMTMKYFDRKFIAEHAKQFSKEKYLKEMEQWVLENVK
jgi:glycosyltransferase involved in cell wall biosynthesis